MSRFRINWPSGMVTVEEVDDCKTIDAFAMSRWGKAAAEQLKEFGVTLEAVPDDEPLRDDQAWIKAQAVAAAKAEKANS
jgi:hypothetical protein